MKDDESDIAGIGTLVEPIRRHLYLYVCAQPGAVGRDEAAEALGLPLHKAKFHLDKLETEGLLQTEFARLSGRSGPGAGRPAKLYRRADREISVSIPAREYELAGRLLADAIAESAATGAPAMEALHRLAAERGRLIGESLTATSGTPHSIEKALVMAGSALAEHGYEPRALPHRIELVNCPFHSLAREHTEMVCGMNLALIDALVGASAPETLSCSLEPHADRCCVVLEAR